MKLIAIQDLKQPRQLKERLLAEKYGWVDTGQHHMDNELFALVYHYSRRKFGFDWRVVELSAKVRTGVISREDALRNAPAQANGLFIVPKIVE